MKAVRVRARVRSTDQVQPTARGNTGVYIFPKGYSLKVNAVAWLEFKLSYYDVAIHHISHYVRPPPQKWFLV